LTSENKVRVLTQRAILRSQDFPNGQVIRLWSASDLQERRWLLNECSCYETELDLFATVEGAEEQLCWLN
jgi:hypothetical protein